MVLRFIKQASTPFRKSPFHGSPVPGNRAGRNLTWTVFVSQCVLDLVFQCVLDLVFQDLVGYDERRACEHGRE